MSGAAIEAGPIREQHCEKHGGRLYLQTFFPSFQEWIGQCDLCGEDERLEHRAREILSTRDVERRRRVQAHCQPDEQQIAKETDAEIERRAQAIVDELESYRPQFEADIRRRHWERTEQDVEAEMITEIVEQLRKGEVNHGRANRTKS